MNPQETKPGRLALCVAAAVLSLAACSDRASEQSAERKVDAAVEKTQDATVAAARKAAELAEKARDNTKAYFQSPEGKQDVAAAKNALKDAGTALTGKTDDAAITASVMAALARDPELSARRIDVQHPIGHRATRRTCAEHRRQGAGGNARPRRERRQFGRQPAGSDVDELISSGCWRAPACRPGSSLLRP